MRLVINRCNPFILDRNRIKIRRKGGGGGEEEEGAGGRGGGEEEKRRNWKRIKLNEILVKRCQRDTCVTLVEGTLKSEILCSAI